MALPKQAPNSDLEELFGDRPSRELKLSYSRCSDFDRNGPKCLLKRSTVDSDGAKIGSITDDLIYTEKVDKAHFSNLYYRYDTDKPTATLLKLTKIITETLTTLPSKKQVLKIVKRNSYWGGTVDNSKLLSRFDTKQFWSYLKAFYASKKLTIVSTGEYQLGRALMETLFIHKNSKTIFKNNYVNIYQQPIYFKINGFIFRGKLDMMIINHEEKTVRMIDLKTGQADAEDFMMSFLKYRYYLQEAVYTAAFNSICKDLKLNGYTLLPFEFLYISRSEKVPIVYEISEKWHKAARDGFTTKGGKPYRGLDELIEEIKWHWDNKVFDETQYLFNSNGRQILEDGFININ